MLSLLAVLALSFQGLTSYLVWPSRWNVPAHAAVAGCVTAFVIPGLLTNVWDDFPEAVVLMFVQMNILGALALGIGTLLGAFFMSRRRPKNSSQRAQVDQIISKMTRRVIIVVFPCVVGMIIAYYIMGFVPMFTDDPLTARQFKGVYQEMYYRAAYLYRFCFSILQYAIALVLAIAWVRRSPAIFLLALSAFIVLFISLSRGPAAAGVILFIGICAAWNRGWLKWYFVLIVIVFPLGSVMFYFLGQIFNIQSLQGGLHGDSFADYIANGSPDISDQIIWLQGFVKGDYFSYGRTIFGGLVPFSYPWNPGVWTLTYDQVGSDVADVASGGLRLSAAEWGFANFGWPGVVLLPLVSGIINGIFISHIKTLVPGLNIWQYTALMMLYGTLGSQLSQFYLLSIHNVPAIVICVLFWSWAKSGIQSRGAQKAQ